MFFKFASLWSTENRYREWRTKFCLIESVRDIDLYRPDKCEQRKEYSDAHFGMY